MLSKLAQPPTKLESRTQWADWRRGLTKYESTFKEKVFSTNLACAVEPVMPVIANAHPSLQEERSIAVWQAVWARWQKLSDKHDLQEQKAKTHLFEIMGNEATNIAAPGGDFSITAYAMVQNLTTYYGEVHAFEVARLKEELKKRYVSTKSEREQLYEMTETVARLKLLGTEISAEEQYDIVCVARAEKEGFIKFMETFNICNKKATRTLAILSENLIEADDVATTLAQLAATKAPITTGQLHANAATATGDALVVTLQREIAELKRRLAKGEKEKKIPLVFAAGSCTNVNPKTNKSHKGCTSHVTKFCILTPGNEQKTHEQLNDAQIAWDAAGRPA